MQAMHCTQDSIPKTWIEKAALLRLLLSFREVVLRLDPPSTDIKSVCLLSRFVSMH